MSVTSSPSQSSLRLCHIDRDANKTTRLGFHLSRTQWDPYPWVSGVESGSGAHRAGLRTGDCVLEVNGKDVLGLRIADVAQRILEIPIVESSDTPGVTLLLWNAGSDPHVAATSVSTPLSLQRLSGCLQSAAQLLECPVCLEVLRPPAWQCCHGHVLCGSCRDRSARCPVCRVPLGLRGRCLVADKLYGLLAATFFERKDSSKITEEQQDNPHTIQLKSRLQPMRNYLDIKLNEKNKINEISSLNITLLKPNTKDSDKILINCPRDQKCGSILNLEDMTLHLRDHKEPILQYFIKDNIKCEVNIKNLKQLITLINEDNCIFFLVNSLHKDESKKMIWVWYFGYDETNLNFNVKIDTKNRSYSGNALSLVNSWQDVIQNKKYFKIDGNITNIYVSIHKVNDK